MKSWILVIPIVPLRKRIIKDYYKWQIEINKYLKKCFNFQIDGSKTINPHFYLAFSCVNTSIVTLFCCQMKSRSNYKQIGLLLQFNSDKNETHHKTSSRQVPSSSSMSAERKSRKLLTVRFFHIKRIYLFFEKSCFHNLMVPQYCFYLKKNELINEFCVDSDHLRG